LKKVLPVNNSLTARAASAAATSRLLMLIIQVGKPEKHFTLVQMTITLMPA